MSSDWHFEDIKAEVRKRGSSLAALARAERVTPQAVYAAAAQPRSERLERAIARFLKIAPKSIWPSRYHSNGTRRRPSNDDMPAVLEARERVEAGT